MRPRRSAAGSDTRRAVWLAACLLGLACLPTGLTELAPQLASLATAPPGQVSVELLRGFDSPLASPAAPPDERVELLLDVSTSMSAQSGAGVTRAEAARRAAARLVKALPASASLGLSALGGRAGECRSSEALARSAAGAARDALLDAIAGLAPEGEGSLATSLDLIGEGLGAEPGPLRVVAFTDLGGECGGDLCRAASMLVRGGARLDLVVFGDAPSPACLESLALDAGPAGGGEAAPAPGFRVEARSGSFGHALLARGLADGTPVDVPAGTAHLVLELDPAVEVGPVFLSSGARTRVRVLEFPNLGRGVREWRWEVSVIDGEGSSR